MIDDDTLSRQLGSTLDKTTLNISNATKYEGKVRDNYVLNGKRIIVVTDRVSAFDVVLTTIPFKGQVLNQMAGFWFDKTRKISKNHVLDVPDPNVTVATECTQIPVEFVVRGYITGVTSTSIWTHYSKGSREFCGHPLPDGLRKDQKLEAPLVTPSTKAEKGGHDESISRDEVIRRGLLTPEDFDEISEKALKLYSAGVKHSAKNGVILVDTKYEFGKNPEGEIVLIDEVHTPDSSRFWFSDSYEELFAKGAEQRKIDKEFVRKWLADKGFKGDGPVPVIPAEVRVETAKRYIQAFELITGEEFTAVPGNPEQRIRESLAGKGYL